MRLFLDTLVTSYNFKIFMLLKWLFRLFWGSHSVVFSLIPDPVLRDFSWYCSGKLYVVWGSTAESVMCWEIPYLLYLFDPYFFYYIDLPLRWLFFFYCNVWGVTQSAVKIIGFIQLALKFTKGFDTCTHSLLPMPLITLTIEAV